MNSPPRPRSFWVLIAFLLPLFAAAARAQSPEYVVLDLGVFPTGAVSVANGVNNRGQVSGWGDTPANNYAFIYSNGTLTNIGATYLSPISGPPVPPAPETYGYGINNNGLVLARRPYYNGHASDVRQVCYFNGSWIDLGIGGLYGSNNLNDVAGWEHYSQRPQLIIGLNPNVGSAFLSPGTWNGAESQSAYAVNDYRQVVGLNSATSRAFAILDYPSGTPTDLGSFTAYSAAFGINNSGQITGYSFSPDGTDHAFLYTGGVMKDLGSVTGHDALGYAINSAGLVTGQFTTSGGKNHAFLAIGLRQTYDVNALIPAGLALADVGMQDYFGNKINDWGQLCGYGILNGNRRAVLLTPRNMGTHFSGGLGDLPRGNLESAVNGVSNGGTLTVGYGTTANGRDAFKFELIGEMAAANLNSAGPAPDCIATGLSADGTVAVGVNGASGHAFRWTTSGPTPLDLPNSPGDANSSANAVAADGTFATGWSGAANGAQAAVVWDVNGRINDRIGTFPGGSLSAGNGVANVNGAAVVTGTSDSGSGLRQGFRWTRAGGLQALPALPGGVYRSAGTAISADGSTIVGQTQTPDGYAAALWPPGGGITVLGDLYGGSYTATALGVSGDGAVVVGAGTDAGGPKAFIWDQFQGLVDLQLFLSNEYGVDFFGWQLTSANSISPDATAIGGAGIDPLGNTQAWIAQINSRTRRFMAGETYKGFHTTRLGGHGSRAELLDGVSAAAAQKYSTLTIDMQAAGAVAMAPTYGYISDIARLTLDSPGAASPDVMVVQLSYDTAVPDSVILGWRAANGTWTNAVDGNTGGAPTFVNGKYDGNRTLGRHGIDTANHVVWAVVNHPGQFAALQIAAPPIVITQPATQVTSGSATLNATVVPRTADTSVSFEYGLTTGYGQTKGPFSFVAGSQSQSVTAPVAGLQPNKTYHFRLTGTNANGPAVGLDRTFTTPQGTQSITFPALGTHTIGDASFALSASASSGLPVVFTILEGPAVLTRGNLVTVTGPGIVRVRATQSGSADYLPAPPTYRSFRVADAAAIFEPLFDTDGTSPNTSAAGISDGALVTVGLSGAGASYWAAGSSAAPLLGDGNVSAALAVTPDGQAIAGVDFQNFDANTAKFANATAFTITPGGTPTWLNRLASTTEARALSADGTIAAGRSLAPAPVPFPPPIPADASDATAWTNGMPAVLPGLNRVPLNGPSVVNAVSADGSVLAGADLNEAVYWLSDGTGRHSLGYLLGGHVSSAALGCSADGQVFVGYSDSTRAPGGEAFRAENGVLIGLGDLPGGTFASVATAVSGDGKIVVGYGTTSAGQEAFIWDALLGMRTLKDELQTHFGLTGLGGWKLLRANAISSDGFAIAGDGINPNGQPQAWRVLLPRSSVFAFTTANATIGESAGTLVLTVTKTVGLSSDVSYQLVPDTAVPVVSGVGDYEASGLSGTLHFETGDTVKTISIPINGDTVAQGNRTFSVVLTGATNGGVLAVPSVTVTILDDDAPDATAPHQTAPIAPPAPGTVSTLTVNLLPPNLGGQWRLLGETAWRDSGTNIAGLVPDDYLVEFKPVGGFAPQPQIVTIVAAQAAAITVTYPATSVGDSGSLTVTIKPDSIATATVESLRGQWRRVGETAWHDSGEVIPGVPTGATIVEFKPLPLTANFRFAAPPNLSLLVSAGDTARLTATYLPAATPAGTLPTVLSLGDATGQGAAADLPYQYCGQFVSDVGFASGVVVTPPPTVDNPTPPGDSRVVLTAAHVVYDDGAHSFVTGLRWRFQRVRDQLETQTQQPRGFYVLSGYAATRDPALDPAAQPGVSTRASQSLDVAAVYFGGSAGRGGSTSMLVSGGSRPDWLTLGRRKTLIGYPQEVVPSTEFGRMFAAPQPPGPVPFSRLYDSASPVFRTGGIAGLSGMSGGPLCVQFEDGLYYPAGIYLGGDGECLVRQIDTTVLDLVTRADVSSNGGQNNNNGGALHVNAAQSNSDFVLGSMVLLLEPPEISGAAGWRIQGETSYRRSGTAGPTLIAGRYTVEFAHVPGYTEPPARTVTLSRPGQVQLSAAYTRIGRPAITTAELPVAGIGLPYSAAITTSTPATSFSATGLPAGLAIDLKTGGIAGTPAASVAPGDYLVAVTALNSSNLPGNAKLTLSVRDPVAFTVTADPPDGSFGKVAVLPPLSPAPGGSGTVAIPGRTYQFTATPKAGSIFAGWTGNSGALLHAERSFQSEVQLADDLVASFVQNPFYNAAMHLDLSGVYRGLLRGQPFSAATAGFVTLTVTRTGAFTGSLQLAGKTYALRGQFDGTGGAGGTLPRPNARPLFYALHLDLFGGSERITGTVSIDDIPAALSADRATFVARTNATAFVGAYTLALPHDATRTAEATYPQGDGYGFVNVSAAGVITLKGVLGDGTTVSQSAALSKAGAWPLYLAPYGTRGAVSGIMTFQPDPRFRFATGTLDWQKLTTSGAPPLYDEMFSGTIAAQASLYLAPEPGERVLEVNSAGALGVTISGGDFLAPLAIAGLRLSTDNKIGASSGTEQLQLSIVTRTGSLGGSFRDAGGTVRRLGGVILRHQNQAFGFYSGQTQTGAVQIKASQ